MRDQEKSMTLWEILSPLLGQANLGRLEFCRRPAMQDSWGGPFNGQKYRQRIFFDLLYHLPFTAIVETGTFRGTTTALFAATSLPVHTVEWHPRNFAYSQLRFLCNRNTVHLYKMDSRSFLENLSQNDSFPKEDVFFYLDAHWGHDLPLREELELIFSHWIRPVVMVDDFQVPHSDYGFDDQGDGRALNLAYIAPVVLAHSLSVFFPAVNSSEETGAKRGSVVLCDKETGVGIESAVSTLVGHALSL